MSANETKVDVLAVMDHVAHMLDPSDPLVMSRSRSAGKRLAEARAAVAELIEAARELLAVSEMAAMLDVFPEHPNANGPIPRTRAALDRIGGAA